MKNRGVITAAILFAVYFIWRLMKGESIVDSLNPVSMLTNSARDKALNLIKEQEGLASTSKNKLKYVLMPALAPSDMVLYAYRDTGGVATIGFGTTHYPGGKAVSMGDTCTVAQAYDFLLDEYTLKEAEIKAATKRTMTDGNLAALCDFAYNAGRGALMSSTLWALWQGGASLEDVAAQFDRWVYDKESKYYPDPVPGLVNRAKARKQIFLS